MSNYFKVLILFILLGCALEVLALRDPTRPADFTLTPMAQQGPLELTAVLISSTRRIAVINETIVKVGSNIQGNKVLAINPNSVQLEGVSGRITLFLVANPVKQYTGKFY